MTSTKKSLAFSALSLVICLAMLIGTTFAWFTDSVESGKNQIIAGNLDVELFNGTTKVGSTTKLFSDVEKWEPGAAAFETLQVKNVGNLALKYQLSFLFENETKVDGHGLSEVLKIGTYAGEITETTKREEVIAAVTDFAPIASFAKSGNLAANTADDAITYVIYWQPGENDNLFNMNNDNKGKTLSIDFWVKLVATQDTVEEDSFDKFYDAATPWLGGTADVPAEVEGVITINTAEELAGFAKAVNAGTTYATKTIKLAKDIDLNNIAWTPIGNAGKEFKGTFDGQNHTVLNLVVSGEKKVGLFGAVHGGTVKNLKVVGAKVQGINAVGTVCGLAYYANIENCSVKDATVTASVKNNDDGDKAGGVVGRLSVEEGTGSVKNCTAENVTVQGLRQVGGVLGGAYKTSGSYDVSGNEAKNSTVIFDATSVYSSYATMTDVREVIGTPEALNAANTATNVTISKIAPVAKGANAAETQINVNEAIAAATAGDIIVLPDNKDQDPVTLPTVVAGVTVKGNGTKIDAAKGKLPNINGATLDGLVLNCGQDDYNGFTHSDAVIKNCTIKGLLFSYNAGGEQVFENCTFINDKEGGGYNMWAYGNVSYKNCTFKSNGKFVNVYNEGDKHFDVNFEGCTFINTKATGNKAAINVKDTCGAIQLNITVNINNCSYQGPDAKGDASKFFNNVVQLDDLGTGTTKVKIVMDEVTLWPEAN